MLRRATLAAVLAVAVQGALAAGSAAAASPPDVLDGVSARATPGSACSGTIGWRSVPDAANPLMAGVEHELLVTCASSGIAIDGVSELHYDLDLDSTNGFDAAYCGPTTLRCHAVRRSPPQLLGLPLRHRVRFTMRRIDGSPWTGDSSICTGEGTSVITCEHNQMVLVGSSGSETFG